MDISTGIMCEFLSMNHNMEQCFTSTENNINLFLTKTIVFFVLFFKKHILRTIDNLTTLAYDQTDKRTAMFPNNFLTLCRVPN